MSNKRLIFNSGIIAVVVLALAAFWVWRLANPESGSSQRHSTIANFEDCVAGGRPVQETYPRQCIAADGTKFSEDIGNELEKADLIVIDSPRPNTEVGHTIVLAGRARGSWYFEASFPVTLQDENAKQIAVGVATAKGEWMTEAFVPFSANLQIPSEFQGKAQLLLQKDNPSGLPENDDRLVVPIIIK